jgi:oxygen-independent coproporphyrinogen-3 oxidase
MQLKDLIFDPQVIRRFDVNGPRYTSYPTADRFVEAFGADDYVRWLGKRTVGGIGTTACHYTSTSPSAIRSATTAPATRSSPRTTAAPPSTSSTWARKSRCRRRRLDGSRDVVQLHFGGGTPTFLSHDEMRS